MTFFTCKIEVDGRMNFGAAKNAFLAYLGDHVGKRLRVEVIKAKRSNPQNSFYWMYLSVIERETGHTAEELHEIFKRLFLPPRFVHFQGKEIKLPGSTTELSKNEFSEYLDRICAESGVPIPDPEQAGFISNYGPLTPVLKEGHA